MGKEGWGEKIGGERAWALVNTHTPLEDNESSKKTVAKIRHVGH
jgi:hypothetical protein